MQPIPSLKISPAGEKFSSHENIFFRALAEKISPKFPIKFISSLHNEEREARGFGFPSTPPPQRRRGFGFPSTLLPRRLLRDPRFPAPIISPPILPVGCRILVASINGGLVRKRRRETLHHLWLYFPRPEVLSPRFPPMLPRIFFLDVVLNF